MGVFRTHKTRRRKERFPMHADREHVISVVLAHEDWKEFVKLQPQPVDWLRERIQEAIAQSEASKRELRTKN
jgi:hypothetical protein